jgi:hypothetical protein
MKLLRQAGEFSNKASVEFATIKVEIPHRLIPSNMTNPFYSDDDTVQGLYVTPTGRLTYKTLYLNSVELAERFTEHLHKIFAVRPYSSEYRLVMTVQTTTMTVTATKGKAKHSALVAELLARV